MDINNDKDPLLEKENEKQSEKKQRWKTVVSHLGMFASQFTYSLLYVAAKYAEQDINVFVFAALRVGMTLIVMLGVCLSVDRTIPNAKGMGLLVLEGLFGVACSQILTTVAVFYTTATNIGLLQPLTPVLTTTCAVLVRQEPPSWIKFLGVFTSVAGVLVIMLQINKFSLQLDQLSGTFGLTLALVACIVQAIALVLRKYILKTWSPVTVTSWAVFYGSAMIIPVGAYYWEKTDFHVENLNTWQWLTIVYSAVIPTAVGYTITSFALSNLKASVVSLYTTLQPIDTAILGYFLLGETVHWYQYLGGGCVVAGMAITTLAMTSEERVKSHGNKVDET